MKVGTRRNVLLTNFCFRSAPQIRAVENGPKSVLDTRSSYRHTAYYTNNNHYHIPLFRFGFGSTGGGFGFSFFLDTPLVPNTSVWYFRFSNDVVATFVSVVVLPGNVDAMDLFFFVSFFIKDLGRVSLLLTTAAPFCCFTEVTVRSLLSLCCS